MVGLGEELAAGQCTAAAAAASANVATCWLSTFFGVSQAR